MDLNILAENLRKRGFDAYIANDEKQALMQAVELIGTNKTVCFGGSATLKEIGLGDKLIENNNKVYGNGFTSQKQTDELGNNIDFYVSSTNAITADGQFVNMDGRGNRVSKLIYGSNKVLIILGKNKIVDTLVDAVARIEKVAAPLNAKSKNFDTPCAHGGPCSDCKVETTMCRALTVIKHPMGNRIAVIIVDKNLGF